MLSASFSKVIWGTERARIYSALEPFGDTLFLGSDNNFTINEFTGAGYVIEYEPGPDAAEKLDSYRHADIIAERCLEKEKKILMNDGMEIRNES